jgi:glycosyltransferase involved in cell wall biosynthesis
MKVGAKAARGDVLIFLDGDGTDPPQYIPRLLKKLNKYDLVLGRVYNNYFSLLFYFFWNRTYNFLQ